MDDDRKDYKGIMIKVKREKTSKKLKWIPCW